MQPAEGGDNIRRGFSAHVAQAVEHFLGKEEVTGSSPVVGSTSLEVLILSAVCGEYEGANRALI
jgi:hypothetical protein